MYNACYIKVRVDQLSFNLIYVYCALRLPLGIPATLLPKCKTPPEHHAMYSFPSLINIEN